MSSQAQTAWTSVAPRSSASWRPWASSTTATRPRYCATSSAWVNEEQRSGLARLLVDVRNRWYDGSRKAAYTAVGVNAATWTRAEQGLPIKERSLVAILKELFPDTVGDWTRLNLNLEVGDNGVYFVNEAVRPAAYVDASVLANARVALAEASLEQLTAEMYRRTVLEPEARRLIREKRDLGWHFPVLSLEEFERVLASEVIVSAQRGVAGEGGALDYLIETASGRRIAVDVKQGADQEAPRREAEGNLLGFMRHAQPEELDRPTWWIVVDMAGVSWKEAQQRIETAAEVDVWADDPHETPALGEQGAARKSDRPPGLKKVYDEIDAAGEESQADDEREDGDRA